MHCAQLSNSLLPECHCKSSHSFKTPFIPLPEFSLLSSEEGFPPCQGTISPLPGLPNSSPAGVSSPAFNFLFSCLCASFHKPAQISSLKISSAYFCHSLKLPPHLFFSVTALKELIASIHPLPIPYRLQSGLPHCGRQWQDKEKDGVHTEAKALEMH